MTLLGSLNSATAPPDVSVVPVGAHGPPKLPDRAENDIGPLAVWNSANTSWFAATALAPLAAVWNWSRRLL